MRHYRDVFIDINAISKQLLHDEAEIVNVGTAINAAGDTMTDGAEKIYRNLQRLASRPTKRELFAAMAMQAIISKTPLEITEDAESQHKLMTVMGAVHYADLLPKELAK